MITFWLDQKIKQYNIVNMNKLTEIANKHRTDKGTEWFEKHSYTETYQSYIPDNAYCKLLEIGVYHGDSVRMWKEYNPQMDLYVMDYDPKCLSTFDHGLCKKVFLGDQSKREDLGKVASGIDDGPLDFVVDDGSHQMAHHHISLVTLLPVLKRDGIYFIEDLHTCRFCDENTRTDKLLKDFAQSGNFNSPFLSSVENQYISNNITGIEFFNADKLVKIIKK